MEQRSRDGTAVRGTRTIEAGREMGGGVMARTLAEGGPCQGHCPWWSGQEANGL